ncbi:hypothetical protein [Marinilabilia salmonicolor]|uniref:hypothetical protein n=1 Tax=Marinilabilia salmonicolor TaxID=989 RepID=UPI00029B3E8A|nr:hypothetical protein [Marinilabilia salmonicolor]
MNKLTSILGVLIILASVATIFLKDYSWMDVSFGIGSGAGLIYVKNNKLMETIKDLQK